MTHYMIIWKIKLFYAYRKNLWIYVKIKSDHADYEDYLSDDYGITDSMRESNDWLDFFVRTEFRISFRSSPAFQEPMFIVLKAFHNIGQHNNHAFYPTPSLRTTIRGSISVLLCRKPCSTLLFGLLTKSLIRIEYQILKLLFFSGFSTIDFKMNGSLDNVNIELFSLVFIEFQ
ncbi:unnamed protein product [Rhizophagus irregularis]|nr:unnamed protein product [Rhizophagus irregularis]